MLARLLRAGELIAANPPPSLSDGHGFAILFAGISAPHFTPAESQASNAYYCGLSYAQQRQPPQKLFGDGLGRLELW
jgi:hypothetical protein